MPFLLLLAAAACTPPADLPPPTAAALPPLQQEAFVWQQRWTPAVTEAISRHAEDFDVLTVLRAEVSWAQGQPRPRWVALDAALLQGLPSAVGLAIRVLPYPGDDPEAAGAALAAVVAELLAQDPWVQELHVDFDAQTAHLADYAAWLRRLRAELGPGRRLSLTALPDWLRQPAFAAVAAPVDRYVLQVHWLAPPRVLGEPLSLIDAAQVPGWVAAAGALGQPFSVALPTYGYRVAYDPVSGEAVGLHAEPGRAVPGAVWREVRASPAVVAPLVAGWQAERPAALQGVSWYRLPVEGDTLNWPWATQAAGRQGQLPEPAREVRLEADGQGLVDVWLQNSGAAGAAVEGVAVAWPEGTTLLAADGLGGLRWEAATRRFGGSTGQPLWLEAGEARAAGWLRFSAAAAVSAEVVSSPETR